MKRKDEIQKLIDKEMGIDNYGSCDFQVGVCYGVRLADKTMIDKATQWLFEHVYDYINPEDQERVESFRKYLED